MSKIAMIAITANEKKTTYKYLLNAYESFFGHRPVSLFTDMEHHLQLLSKNEKTSIIYGAICIYIEIFIKNIFLSYVKLG